MCLGLAMVRGINPTGTMGTMGGKHDTAGGKGIQLWSVSLATNALERQQRQDRQRWRSLIAQGRRNQSVRQPASQLIARSRRDGWWVT